MKRITVGVLLLVLVALSASAQAQGPVLQNGNFDGPFTVREAQEVEVAQGWEYSYMSGDDRWCRAPCYRPEYKPEQQIAVGGTSQRWFTTYARQFGTIHQVVPVTSGEWYTFACDVYAISEPDGQLAALVGINPWGVGVFDRTMIWGEQQPWASYRQWHRLSVTARAYGGQIRVAVGGNNAYPTKNNAVYVDNCTLTLADIGGECPECPECPTCPPGEGCDYQAIGDVLRGVLESMTWAAK